MKPVTRIVLRSYRAAKRHKCLGLPAQSLGNLFRDAAVAAGMKQRLHGLRKAFCVYWAEQGKSTQQIAAMAGHLTLGEVERYTRPVDRQQIVRLIVEGA